MTTVIIVVLALSQFAMTFLYFKKIAAGFTQEKVQFASHIFERDVARTKYWGLMAFYAVCIFGTLLIGMLLMSLI